MADAPFRRSPLFHRPPIQGESARSGWRSGRSSENSSCAPTRRAAVEPLRAALGLGLPFDPLTSATSGDTSFLWMGPDEWMLVTAPADAAERAAAARAALAGNHHQLVDVGDYYTIIEVAGPKAREALMKLTTLDLASARLQGGHGDGLGLRPGERDDLAAARSRRRGTFRLFIRWSMADYLWCLLANAGREWGVPEQVPVKGERLTIGIDFPPCVGRGVVLLFPTRLEDRYGWRSKSQRRADARAHELVQDAVAAGDYASTSEVIREALRDWKDRRERKREAMLDAAAPLGRGDRKRTGQHHSTSRRSNARVGAGSTQARNCRERRGERSRLAASEGRLTICSKSGTSLLRITSRAADRLLE